MTKDKKMSRAQEVLQGGLGVTKTEETPVFSGEEVDGEEIVSIGQLLDSILELFAGELQELSQRITEIELKLDTK